MTARTDNILLPQATIRLDNLPAGGRSITINATPEQLEAMAGRLGVDAVEAFSASLQAVPVRGGVQVSGNLQAKVTQPCVVSFVPVTEDISESFTRIFLPGREQEYKGPAGAEVFVDLEGEDLPDYFEGPEVDFNGLLLETLSLAINPYPRAPGAELPAELVDGDGEESPFAGLEQLKSPRD